jgi:hypothetical protein
MFPILVLIAATVRPPNPTVGDLITIDFPAPVTVQAATDFEIVSRAPRRVVIRAFDPKPLVVHTSSGDVVVAMRSVLQPNDPLQPSPLKPPREEAYPRMPFYAIAAAAFAAIAMWTLAWLLSRRRAPKPVIVIAPADAFRIAVTAAARSPKKWADLADALRAYLAASDARFGSELTTSEVLERSDDPVIAEVLRQGDLEKFSPWGARATDFDSLAVRALGLIPAAELEQAA